MSDRENLEKGDEEAKETDTRRESTSIEETEVKTKKLNDNLLSSLHPF